MINVTFVRADGEETTVETPTGISVMEVAVENNIAEILAECGGSLSCATCHIYVDEAWLDKVSPVADIESGLLELVEEVADNSRLSCQLQLEKEHDGLIVNLPESQY